MYLILQWSVFLGCQVIPLMAVAPAEQLKQVVVQELSSESHLLAGIQAVAKGMTLLKSIHKYQSLFISPFPSWCGSLSRHNIIKGWCDAQLELWFFSKYCHAGGVTYIPELWAISSECPISPCRLQLVDLDVIVQFLVLVPPCSKINTCVRTPRKIRALSAGIAAHDPTAGSHMRVYFVRIQVTDSTSHRM